MNNEICTNELDIASNESDEFTYAYHDESYEGYDITIFSHKNGSFTADIKYPCGELIYGWLSYFDDFDQALEMAKSFILSFGKYKKPHCDSEYCQMQN